MLHLQTNTELSFTVASDWSEVSLGQYTAYLEAKTEADILAALSGCSSAELRLSNAIDLSRITTYLAYLQVIPDFQTMPVPDQLLIGDTTVEQLADIHRRICIGQMWDIDRIYQSRLKQELPVDFIGMAPTVLSIFLYPLVTKQPYSNDEEARVILPSINQLNLVDALPLANRWWEMWKNPPSSGRITVTTIPTHQPQPNTWREKVRLFFT